MLLLSTPISPPPAPIKVDMIGPAKKMKKLDRIQPKLEFQNQINT